MKYKKLAKSYEAIKIDSAKLQEQAELKFLIRIYEKSNRDFELAIRRYVMQIDLTNVVLVKLLEYIDENYDPV